MLSLHDFSDFLFEVIFGLAGTDIYDCIADAIVRLDAAAYALYQPWEQMHLEMRGYA